MESLAERRIRANLGGMVGDHQDGEGKHSRRAALTLLLNLASPATPGKKRKQAAFPSAPQPGIIGYAGPWSA
jgi:hypothetical protein